MKTTNEIKQFKDWSAEWKDERKKIDADQILKLWQKAYASRLGKRNMGRKSWLSKA